jgi:hypothetical protein
MTTIMVMRHGEKPLGDGPPHGVDGDGNPDPESLTPRGWQRAGALLSLFPHDAGAARSLRSLATPTHLFASHLVTATGSRRTRETLDPLAARLNLAIDMRFNKLQVSELAQAAIGAGGVNLIAWEHHMIPSLAAAIVGRTDGIPVVWPDDCYDVIWIFEPAVGGAGFAFRQVAQQLLAGDRTEVIAV